MHQTLVMTLLGPDRTGIVEELAAAVRSVDGNWLDSHLVHVGGQFGGVVHLALPADRVEQFGSRVKDLERKASLRCLVAACGSDPEPGDVVSLDVVGQDRPGIVFALGDALAEFQVNVESMDTTTSSAPMSGETLFHASLRVRTPADVDFPALERRLEEIGDELMLDVRFEEG